MAGRDFLIRQANAAARLGHVVDLVERVPGKFRATCSCGYESTNRRTQAAALGAAMHHAGGVVGAARRDGRTIPPAPGDTPELEEMPRSKIASL